MNLHLVHGLQERIDIHREILEKAEHPVPLKIGLPVILPAADMPAGVYEIWFAVEVNQETHQFMHVNPDGGITFVDWIHPEHYME